MISYDKQQRTLRYKLMDMGRPITETMMFIPMQRCYILIPQKGRGKRPIRKEGFVVGAYESDARHGSYVQIMYHHYHVLFDDETKATMHWRDVKLVTN